MKHAASGGVGVVVPRVSLFAVFSAFGLVDAGALRFVVTPERDVDPGQEPVHASPKIKRPFRMSVNATFAFEDEQ